MKIKFSPESKKETAPLTRGQKSMKGGGYLVNPLISTWKSHDMLKKILV